MRSAALSVGTPVETVSALCWTPGMEWPQGLITGWLAAAEASAGDPAAAPTCPLGPGLPQAAV